jgi:hypothetical protein
MEHIFDRIITEPLKDLFQRIVEFLPNFFSSLIILILGFILGWIIRSIILRVLDVFNTDRFCNKVGLTHALEKGGIKETPTKLIGQTFYLLIVFTFIAIALYTLKIPAVENLMEKFFLYLPDVFIAAILITIGYVLSSFLARATLIAAVNAGIKFSGLLSKGVKFSIMVLTLTMALEQLGIGRETVIMAFSIIFGGVIFAMALAFGLAGKDLARDYLEKRLKHESEEENDIQHL